MELARTLSEAISSTQKADQIYFGHMGGSSSFVFGLMMILWWITWLLVIIALVLFIVWLWKQIQGRK